MGSSKKKKEKKRDFAKAKLKLGKGKQQAANATNTSFTSRSIALGRQTIGRERSDVPTTKRNLSLEDLQNHLKHYNASTRKDALAGLRELITAYPDLHYSSVNTLLPLLARTIGDEDGPVRKSLLSFLEWYLPILPDLILSPYHSILIFFTTSALSHIYPEVRMDAVRALDLLLDNCQSSIALQWNSVSPAGGYASTSTEQNHPERVLEAYLALLHVRSGIATNGLSTSMSPKSKALVLTSLATFLRVSLAPEGYASAEEQEERARPALSQWFLSGSFATLRDYNNYVSTSSLRLVDDSTLLDPNGVDDEEDGIILSSNDTGLYSHSLAGLSSITDLASELLHDGDSRSQAKEALPRSAEALLLTLLPILVSAFLDTAPTAFSPSAPASSSANTPDVALETVLAVACIARDLWRAIVMWPQSGDLALKKTAEIMKGLEKLVGHMGAYFPFGTGASGKRRSEDDTKLQSLNIAFCELVSLLHLASTQKPSGSESVSLPSSKLDMQVHHVRNYVKSLLAGTHATIINPVGTNLTPHAFAQLLPTIWSLLLLSPSKDESTMLEALLQHFLSLSAGSGVKKISLSFLVRILTLHEEPSFVHRKLFLDMSRRPQMADLHDKWLISLPRYLWELGTSDSQSSFTIIAYIQEQAANNSLLASAKDKLCALIVPYFASVHPSKGIIKGPWVRQDDLHLQGRALQMAWWLTRDEAAEGSKKLCAAVTEAIKVVKEDELLSIWNALLSI